MENAFSFAMTKEFLSLANFPAILVGGLVYFGIGFLWYSVLFRDSWKAEIERSGIKIPAPTEVNVPVMMGKTLLGNILVSLGMAFLNYHAGVNNALAGAKIGLLAAALLGIPLMLINYNWQGHSLKLLLIDGSYAVAGMIACGILTGAWR